MCGQGGNQAVPVGSTAAGSVQKHQRRAGTGLEIMETSTIPKRERGLTGRAAQREQLRHGALQLLVPESRTATVPLSTAAAKLCRDHRSRLASVPRGRLSYLYGEPYGVATARRYFQWC